VFFAICLAQSFGTLVVLLHYVPDRKARDFFFPAKKSGSIAGRKSQRSEKEGGSKTNKPRKECLLCQQHKHTTSSQFRHSFAAQAIHKSKKLAKTLVRKVSFPYHENPFVVVLASGTSISPMTART